MKQKKLIFTFVVNRTWKKLTDSRKRAKILADDRKSHHPIETLFLAIEISVQFYFAGVSTRWHFTENSHPVRLFHHVLSMVPQISLYDSCARDAFHW